MFTTGYSGYNDGQVAICEVVLTEYRLDPNKFPRVRRNIILTYLIMGLFGLGVVYLNVRDALFSSAWPLIPFVVLLFSIAGWFAVKQRKQNWDEFLLTIRDNMLVYAVYKMPELTLKKSDITGVRLVRQGLIVSTRLRENALLISKDLSNEDFSKLRQILENWSQNKN